MTAANFSGLAPDGTPTPGQAFTGTDGRDTLTGTAGDDTIHGLGGDDVISGGAGNDVLEGGTGADTLDGGLGDDLMLGGDGDDYLRDSNGSDTLIGGAGNDGLSVFRDSKALGDRVRMEGGEGDDLLTFQSLSSEANFSAVLDGGSGADTFDLLALFGGSATITTGLGADTIRISHARQGLTVTDFTAGLDGDRFDLTGLLSNGLSNWDGSNPFGTGHVRLVQSGSDTLVQIDSDGRAGPGQFLTMATLQNVQAAALTAANFSGLAPAIAAPTAVVNAPASIREGEIGSLSITFFDVSRLQTTITVTITGISKETGEEVTLSVGSYQVNLLQAPASDYTYSLGEIAAFDDLLIEGVEIRHVQVQATGQVFGEGGDRATLSIEIIDNDIRGTASSDTIVGGAGQNLIEGGRGDDHISGLAGADVLFGEAGDDFIYGGAGDDLLSGGRGFDTIDGGGGTDTLLLTGSSADYSVMRLADGYRIAGFAEADVVSNVEYVSFDGGRTSITLAEFEQKAFDPYAYMVANPDIFVAFGVNGAEAARNHYFTSGVHEGRDPGSFDALTYIASSPDLIAAFGTDVAKATEHYMVAGRYEGRPTNGFNALAYAATHLDLALAFGTDTGAATRHYIGAGFFEGRAPSGFDALRYAASNPEVARAVGLDAIAAMIDYLTSGAKAGLPVATFDPLIYSASHIDLALAFGADAGAALKHYLAAGVHEGRATTGFDALAYLAANPDLASYFGMDQAAGLSHYLNNGALEGRPTSGFDSVGYLLTYGDLAGLGATGALSHWLWSGADEGRIGDMVFGRDQDSHRLSGTATSVLEQDTDRDWFETTLAGGERIAFGLSGSATKVELYDALGNRLAPAPGQASHIFDVPATGSYYVVVFGAGGAYTVTSSSVSVSASALADAATVEMESDIPFGLMPAEDAFLLPSAIEPSLFTRLNLSEPDEVSRAFDEKIPGEQLPPFIMSDVIEHVEWSPSWPAHHEDGWIWH